MICRRASTYNVQVHTIHAYRDMHINRVGKSVHFLLSGFFCCLCFSGMFFLGRDVFYFFLFGRGRGPRANSQNKNTTSPKQQKNKHAPSPSERVFFCSLGGWACLFVCCLGGWRFCFLLFGRVCVCFFLLFGRGRVYFIAVWAGCRVLFFFVWARGRVFFAVWAGDGSSLTYRFSWIVFKRPNNKKDQTAKNKRVPNRVYVSQSFT